eukprot:TRINITY_DN16523_c0_g1_i1.p1 TRINITY_DN16523_c0_g1~~TRINITY_DN16523_c0_g1_i1.p1  ORF type:complete len:317 (+),score=52.29 TRINITY_DN16523_c0_g1_i1:158-1108(+)
MLVLAALVAALCPGVSAFGEAQKFLIVSSVETSRVAYLKLPSDGGPAVFHGQALRTLIDSGLVFPQGIAVDEYRNRLFVADPNLTGLVMYPISSNGDTISVGKQQIVASGVQTRAVSVDGLGNVIFSDEPTSRIMKVSDEMIQAGNTKAVTLYDGNTLTGVKAPGGVAMDNYFVYWLNKASGTKVGTLMRGLQYPATSSDSNSSGTPGVSLLAKNAPKCYGVCIAGGNVFYTDEAKNLYGINRASTSRHTVYTISSHFQEPRGCAYDGDGTVYVADKTQNAIFQFASSMRQLEPNRQMTKAAELQSPFGLAVYALV